MSIPSPSPLPDEPNPAVGLMRELRMEPDPWQIEVLHEQYHHLLLNCCRQAGKSTVVAMLGLSEALFHRSALVLLVCAAFANRRSCSASSRISTGAWASRSWSARTPPNSALKTRAASSVSPVQRAPSAATPMSRSS